MPLLQGIFGIFAFLGIAWCLSENRKKIDYKFSFYGILGQFFIALMITKAPPVRAAFLWMGGGVSALKDATADASKFVFGYLAGATPPFDLIPGGNTFIFAFQPLPMILVFSALASLLFYWGVLPFIVRKVSWVLTHTLKIGGALGVVAAAKIFFGQVEAPLLIRPYLKKFSRSELFSVITCGMATTSGTIMVLYASILEGVIPQPMSHILATSLITIPAALVISRVIIPQVGKETSGDLISPYNFNSSMEAISQGTIDGVKIIVNVAAMLIVVLAFVSLVNKMLGLLPPIGDSPLTLQALMGFIMAPIAWLMGIPWKEAAVAGNLIGTKTVLNEVVAFISLANLNPDALSTTSKLIMTYALCGFANFSSLGIIIGGIGSMVPERRDDIIDLGIKTIIAGTIATCMSGTMVGIISQLL